MKVVIIGSDGQLGFDLVRTFGDSAIGLTHQDIEISDKESVRRVLRFNRPDVVINTAAIVKSEWCEENQEACFLINAAGAGNVAEAAKEINAAIVQISTDYVFDGSKDGFSETDVPNPLNVYGSSKLEGERLVRVANPSYYIIRSSWFFGKQISHKGLDFPHLVLKLAREQGQVRMVNDQFGSPTYTRDLAGKIKELLTKEAPFDIYHITNQGVASWYDFAKEVLQLRGIKAKLTPISSAESNSKLKRPRNSVLNNSKLKELGIPLLREWREALREYFQETR